MEKSMKLSNETLTVLKNFSGINQNIQFKKGRKLTTVSAGKTVLAQANLKDDFPQDCCVYDLNQFLNVLNLRKDTEIDFNEPNIIFKAGRASTKFRMTSKEMIVTPPEKEITLPSVDCSFTLSAEDYDDLMKATNALSSPHISVSSDGESIDLVSFDAADNSAHTNSISVGQGNGKKYNIVFKTENIKLISGSYDVSISFKGIGHFKNTKDDIQYWIAFEAKETTIPQ
jgi:hypothetical protein